MPIKNYFSDIYSSVSSPTTGPASLARRSNTEPNLTNQADSDEMVSSCANFVEAVLNRSSSEADINGVHMMLSEAVVAPLKVQHAATHIVYRNVMFQIKFEQKRLVTLFSKKLIDLFLIKKYLLQSYFVEHL